MRFQHWISPPYTPPMGTDPDQKTHEARQRKTIHIDMDAFYASAEVV